MGVHIGRRTESLLRDGLQAGASVEAARCSVCCPQQTLLQASRRSYGRCAEDSARYSALSALNQTTKGMMRLARC